MNQLIFLSKCRYLLLVLWQSLGYAPNIHFNNFPTSCFFLCVISVLIKKINYVLIIRFGCYRKTLNNSALNQRNISLFRYLSKLSFEGWHDRSTVLEIYFIHSYFSIIFLTWLPFYCLSWLGQLLEHMQTSKKRWRGSGGLLSFNSSHTRSHTLPITSYLMCQMMWFFLFSECPFCIALWYFFQECIFLF